MMMTKIAVLMEFFRTATLDAPVVVQLVNHAILLPIPVSLVFVPRQEMVLRAVLQEHALMEYAVVMETA